MRSGGGSEKRKVRSGGKKKKQDEVKKKKKKRDGRDGAGNVSHAETIQLKSAPCVLQSLIIP